MGIFGFKDVGFEIKTASLGALNFHRVSPEYAARIEKADFQHDLPPDAFLSLLLVILGTKKDGRPILVEEAYALLPSEREAFVQAFLNEHGEYYRERISEERTSDSGEKVIRSYLGDRIVNPRHIGEEPAAYLTRVYRDFAAGIVTPEVRVVEPERPAVEPARPVAEERNDAFADSFLKNAALSESLGKSLAQMKMLGSRDEEHSPATAPVEPIDNPPDSLVAEQPPAPVEPTDPSTPDTLTLAATLRPLPALDFSDSVVGESLSELKPPTDELRYTETAPPDAKQTVELVQNLHDSVLRSLEEYAENAAQNARAAKSSRRTAVLALFLALILPALTVAYLTWKEGLWGRGYNRSLTEQSAQAADQKQQIETLKTIVDQLRAQRTQSSARRVAD